MDQEELYVVGLLLEALEELMECDGGEPPDRLSSSRRPWDHSSRCACGCWDERKDLQERSDKAWQQAYEAVARGYTYKAGIYQGRADITKEVKNDTL